MIKVRFSERGFGMLQAMIFAGIIAAGALVATRVINDLKLTQRGSATKDELEILHRSVEAALQDSYNCTATRQGFIDVLSPSRVILADSNNSTGQLADNPVIIQVGEVYGGNSVKVDSIVFTSANILGAASDNQQVIVTYSRLKSDAANRLGQGYGGKDVRRVIPITVITGDAFDGGARCYADPKTGTNYFSSGSIEKFCRSLGSFMIWEASQRKCNRNIHVCPAGQAFMGVNASGAIICQNLRDAMNATNLFDTSAPTSCPGRTQLQLVVVGGKITIQCIASGSANLAWSPLTHNFGQIEVTTNSPDQTFTLTNSGTSATAGCTAPVISDTTNFTLTPNGNCVGTNNLPAGSSCTVTVRANPTSNGIKTATLVRSCATGGSASTTSNMIVAEGVSCAPPVLNSVNPTSATSFNLVFTGIPGVCATVGTYASNSSSGPWISNHGSCSSPRVFNTSTAGTWYFKINQYCGGVPGGTPDSNIVCVPQTTCTALRANDCPAAPDTIDGCGNPCGAGTRSSGCSGAGTCDWLVTGFDPGPGPGSLAACQITGTTISQPSCTTASDCPPTPFTSAACGDTYSFVGCGGGASGSPDGTWVYNTSSCHYTGSNGPDSCASPPLSFCPGTGWGQCGQTANCMLDPSAACGGSPPACCPSTNMMTTDCSAECPPSGSGNCGGFVGFYCY